MCAWIESHQSLLTHRKTIRAVSVLKVDRYKFIGHLHALWWWALDSAEDGNLGSVTDPEVALAAGWPVGRAEEFVAALSKAGFLDADRCLHGWDEYAGKLVDRRRRNREQMRDARTRRVEHVSTTPPTRVEDVGDTCKPTQPTQPTEPTQQYHTTTPPPPTPSSDADASAGGGGALDSDFGRICASFEDNRIGKLTPASKGRLEELSYEFTADWFEAAVREAVKHNGRSLAYVEAVLQRWQKEGFQAGVPPGKREARHKQTLASTDRSVSLAGRYADKVCRTTEEQDAVLESRASP